MIKTIKMFTVICDRCGKDSNAGSDYAAWSDLEGAVETALEADWYCEDGKHYCPDCFKYDDNDNLILEP